MLLQDHVPFLDYSSNPRFLLNDMRPHPLTVRKLKIGIMLRKYNHPALRYSESFITAVRSTWSRPSSIAGRHCQQAPGCADPVTQAG
jgi:hypothetical protein